LPRALMDWFSRQYLGDADRAFETSCSLCRITTAVGLPPAIIAIAGHDILFQDGKAYAERLSADCVPTEVYTFSTLPHAFSIMAGAIPAARAAMNFLARRVGVRLGSL
jgi:acetyl esterase